MSVNVHERTSTLIQTAAILLVAVIVSTGSAPVHRHRSRVGRPCSGSNVVPGSHPSPTAYDETVSHHHLRRAVRGVTRLLGALYDDVSRLKSDYATERDVVHMGMHVDGVPRHNEIRLIAPLSQADDLPSKIAEITSKLSRMAVFIGLLRVEERRHEPLPFDDELRRVEDDTEHGLYGILCRLHVIHRLTSALNETTTDASVDLTASIDATLAGVELEDAGRPAHRHLRTFSVIHDFTQLLQHLVAVFNDLDA